MEMKKYTLGELQKELGIEQRNPFDLKGQMNKTYSFFVDNYMLKAHPELSSTSSLIHLGFLAGDLALSDGRGVIEVTKQFPLSILAAYSVGAYPCDVIANISNGNLDFYDILTRVQNGMGFEDMDPPVIDDFNYWSQLRQRDSDRLRNPLSFARLTNSKSPVVLANDPDSLGELENYVNARKCPLIYTNASGNFIKGVSNSVWDTAFDFYAIEDRDIHGFARVPKKDLSLDDTLTETFIDNPYEP